MFKFMSTISDDDAKELYHKLQDHLMRKGVLTFQPVLLTDPRAEQQVVVETAPIADAPKVEGAQCIANFRLATGPAIHIPTDFDPTTVKRNPFYFGDSKTTNEPVTQADGIADGIYNKLDID